MTSYVFSVMNKKIIWSKVHQILAEKYDEEFEMIFALASNNDELADLKKLEQEQNNVLVLTFDPSYSENKMLSEAIRHTQGDNMVLCRDYFEYATVMSDLMIGMGAMNVQVALYRKPQKSGKIRAFFKKIYHRLVEWIFGFKLYEGDVGLEYFGNIPLSILRTLPNNILLTKVNKWNGFDISYIEADELKEKQFDHHEKKGVLKALWISGGIFALLLGLFITFAIVGWLGFLSGLVGVLLLLIVMFYMVYLCLKLSIVCQHGDLA